MQQAFLKCDANQDGRISKKELMVKCREWNIPTSEAERVLKEADMDRDGTLDFNEFAQRFNGGLSRVVGPPSGRPQSRGGRPGSRPASRPGSRTGSRPASRGPC